MNILPLTILIPCSICKGKAEMVRDEFGFSVWHECINMSTRGAINQPTQQAAEKAWREMQE